MKSRLNLPFLIGLTITVVSVWLNSEMLTFLGVVFLIVYGIYWGGRKLSGKSGSDQSADSLIKEHQRGLQWANKTLAEDPNSRVSMTANLEQMKAEGKVTSYWLGVGDALNGVTFVSPTIPTPNPPETATKEAPNRTQSNVIFNGDPLRGVKLPTSIMQAMDQNRVDKLTNKDDPWR